MKRKRGWKKSCTLHTYKSTGKTDCVRNDQALAIFCRKDQPGFDLGGAEGIYFFCPPSIIFTPGSCQFFFYSFTPLLLVWPWVCSAVYLKPRNTHSENVKIGFLIKIRVMHKDFHPDWIERKRPPFGLRIARPLSGDSKRKAPLQEYIYKELACAV